MVAVADLPLHYMINNNDIYKGHRSFVVDVLFVIQKKYGVADKGYAVST